jgi:phosphotransferase system HPr (HPr) family protein
MEKLKLILNNPDGLHARPAAIFVQEASKFKSDIEIEFQGQKVNAKSIIGVMSLGAFHGEEISLIADGPDENKALEALQKLVESGLNKI